MGKFAYVNGQYVPHKNAVLSIDDRGLQFGDAAYEVYCVLGGNTVDKGLHLDRLESSLEKMGIALPMSRRALDIIIKNLLRKNNLKNGLVYFQVSRGTYTRDHCIPDEPLKPNMIITTKNIPIPFDFEEKKSIKVITQPDIRWGRVDIKTIMLLPNCLAKTEAYRQGSAEVIFVKNNLVTESAAANFWFVDAVGTLVTTPKGGILMGITRRTLIKCAKNLQMKVEERTFTLEEAMAGREAFISSATTFATAVSHINDKAIGAGENPIVSCLYAEYVKLTTEKQVCLDV